MSRKPIRHTFGALLLASCVFITNTTSALAAENPGKVSSKDEVVYASLSASGKTENIYVVNILEVTKAGAVFDYGNYNAVKNLTDLSVVTLENGVVRADAKEGKFYYQGNLGAAPLPWQIQVIYLLNGKELSPEQIAGRDGDLEIKIHITADPRCNPAFYENYLLQVSLSLDGNTCTNITAPGSSIANAGTEKQVTFTQMPGKDGNYSVTAQVKAFEMDGISIAAIPYNLSIELPDTSGMTGDMNELADAIRQLRDGVKKLTDGVNKFYDGVSELQDGSKLFRYGMREADGGSTDLVDASRLIKQSLGTISASLSSGSLPDLSDLSALPKTLTQLSEGLNGAKDGLISLKTNYGTAYSSLDKAILKIPDGSIPQAELEQLLANNSSNTALLSLINFYTAAQSVKGTYAAVKPVLDAVGTTLEQISGSVGTIANTLNGISKQLEGSLAGMDLSQLGQLAEGLTKLYQNYGEFHSGLAKFMNGIAELAESYDEIHTGISHLQEGAGELHSGSNELLDGTEELYDQTKDLPEQVTEKIDEITSEYDKSDFKPVSYLSDQNSPVGSVQFVIKTAAVQINDPPVPEAVPSEPQTFWQKLLSLFGIK